MRGPFNLQRFVDAQDAVFEQVRSELRNGEKTTHWMWFIFPQIQGLGRTEMSRRFAISSLDEARAYLAHSVLGLRLVECTELVLAAKAKSVGDIFDHPDDLKFHSSMTLFALAAPQNHIFRDALKNFFGGHLDPLTVERCGLNRV